VQDQLETRDEEAAPARDVLGMAEAARVSGVPLSVIRRHRDAGDLPGAYRDARGTWRIPVPDLRAIGLLPAAPPAAVHDRAPHRPAEAPVPAVTSEQEEIHRLRTEVAVLRERLAAVQLIAKERGDRIADLRVIVRMFPQGSTGQGPKPSVQWLSEAASPRPDAAATPATSGSRATAAAPSPPPPPQARRAQAAPSSTSRPVHIAGWRETFDDIPPGRHGKRPHGHRRSSGWSRLLWRGEE
jgi:hypothetical protein